MRKITRLCVKSFLPLLLSVLLLLPFLPAASGALGWTDMMGPGNGSGRALIYDAVRGNLYRGTQSRGAWRYKSGVYTDMGLGNTYVNDFAYDSANNILYAVSGTVYRCTDPDTSPAWTSLGRSAQSIAYDAGRNLLYAGSTAGVWRCATPDGTPSWTDVTGGFGTGNNVGDLEMDSPHDQLYAGASVSGGAGLGTWRCDSPDSSPSWSNTGTISDYFVHYLTYDVGHNKLYAGATKGFDSQTWRCDTPGTAPAWTGIGSADSPMAYDATRNKLYISKYGYSTQRCDNPDTAPVWTKLDDTLKYKTAYSLACDATNDVLYIGTQDNYTEAPETGVWKCTTPDGTPAWSFTGGGISEAYMVSSVFDTTNNRLYTGGGQYGIWRWDTPDTTPTFTDIWGGNVYNMVGLALNGSGTRLYVATQYGGGVWRCDDPGSSHTWTRISSGFPLDSYEFYSIAYDDTRNVLYAGTAANGIWRCDTPDTTPTWTDISGTLSTYRGMTMAFDTAHNKLYAGMGNYPGHGLWRCDTPNTTPSWTNMDPGGTMENRYFMSLAYDSGKDLLYCGVDLGVYRCATPDSSPAWTQLNTTTTTSGVMALDADNDVLFTFAASQHQRCDTPDGTPSWSSIGGPALTTTMTQTCDGTRRALYEGTNYRSTWRYDYLPTAPSITSLSDDSGHEGDTISIFGHSFGASRGTSSVTFNTTVCQTSDYVSWSADTIRVKVPTGATSGQVTVTTDGGTSNGKDFTVLGPAPTITSITPNTGVQGTTVPVTDLAGTNFSDVGGEPVVKLTKSGQPDITANTVNVQSPTRITCNIPIPAGAQAGGWDLYVQNHDGQDATKAPAFTITHAAPTVTSITPNFGTSGTIVNPTIEGTGFYGTPVVKLRKTGETDITATGVSGGPTSLTCFFDIPLNTADGPWDVYVENPDTQGVTLPNGFNQNNPAPTVTSITPATGVRGTSVSITNLAGTNFINRPLDPVVKLKKSGQADITATNVIRVSATKLTCTVPLTSAAVGAWDVYVENHNGAHATLAGAFTVAYPAPTVTSITPSSWPTGQSCSITSLAGSNFRAGATVKLKKSGKADIDATSVSVASASKITCKFNLVGAAQGAWNVVVANTDAKSATRTNSFTVTAPVYPTWYLAEGTTAWGFSTHISIQNPNTTPVHASINYMTGSGNVSGGTIPLPAKSQTTVNPADTLGNKDFSTKVTCTEGKTIAVDRTMSWTGPGAASPEGHTSVGVTAPAKTWYLPEGSSAWGFECWLLIQNPNGGTATASVTYMIEGGAPVTKTHTVPANSRQSFNMEADIGQKNASIKVDSNIAVIPERAMYRNNKREGHDSIGTTTAANDYFLAEGTTAWGFTTWVLIQNPGASPSDVTITYMTPSGKKVQPSFSLAGNSRKTIKVNDVAGMGNTDFSTQVHGSKAIIAERSMYWDNGTGEACHDSIGMDQAHTTFYLPDGQTSGGYETWTLVQNPNASAVTVEVSYLKAGGGAGSLTSSIPANSRMTFNMADKVPSGRASIMVTSKTAGKKIMVERAMYWNNKGAGTDTIGGFSD